MQLLITSFYAYMPDKTNTVVMYFMKKLKNKSLKLNEKFNARDNKQK